MMGDIACAVSGMPPTPERQKTRDLKRGDDGSRPGSSGMARVVAPGTGTDRVIQRVITRNAESSAGLKVPHVEITVLSVIRAGIPVGSFTQECVADNGPSASTTPVR